MAGFHFSFPDADKPLFTDAFNALRDRIATGLRLAVAQLVDNIKRKGDSNILSAGKFTARWTKAFQVQPDPPLNSNPADKYTISVFFDQSIPYAHIHEFGGTITAKGTLFGPPMLWIPLSFGDVPQSKGGANAGKMTAQEYGASVSPLFQVKRKAGAPLLLDIKDKRPRYFGIPSVTLKPKFGIREMCKREVADFQGIFSAAVAATQGK